MTGLQIAILAYLAVAAAFAVLGAREYVAKGSSRGNLAMAVLAALVWPVSLVAVILAARQGR